MSEGGQNKWVNTSAALRKNVTNISCGIKSCNGSNQLITVHTSCQPKLSLMMKTTVCWSSERTSVARVPRDTAGVSAAQPVRPGGGGGRRTGPENRFSSKLAQDNHAPRLASPSIILLAYYFRVSFYSVRSQDSNPLQVRKLSIHNSLPK